MKPLMTVLLGLGAVAAGLAIFSKGPGDEVQPFDVALVPVTHLPDATIRGKIIAALKEDPRFKIEDLSLGVRADTVSADSIAGPPFALFVKNGAPLEMATTTQELAKSPAVTVPKDRIVGILKRGVPVAADKPAQLETGTFV